MVGATISERPRRPKLLEQTPSPRASVVSIIGLCSGCGEAVAETPALLESCQTCLVLLNDRYYDFGRDVEELSI